MNVPETFFSVNEELTLFGLSCIMGVLLGICYDVFRTARILFPHNNWLIAIEDIIFLALYAAALLSFSTAAARGELRFYYVLGNFLGFMLYILTLGSIVTAIMKKLFFAVKKTIHIIFAPFKRCCAFLRKKTGAKFVGCSKIIVNSIKKVKMLLLKGHSLMYNKKEIKKKERGRRWQKKQRGK